MPAELKMAFEDARYSIDKGLGATQRYRKRERVRDLPP